MQFFTLVSRKVPCLDEKPPCMKNKHPSQQKMPLLPFLDLLPKICILAAGLQCSFFVLGRQARQTSDDFQQLPPNLLIPQGLYLPSNLDFGTLIGNFFGKGRSLLMCTKFKEKESKKMQKAKFEKCKSFKTKEDRANLRTFLEFSQLRYVYQVKK